MEDENLQPGTRHQDALSQVVPELRELGLQVLDGIGRCRQDTAMLLSQEHSTHPQLSGTLYALLEYGGERSQSMLILAEHNRLWDAEIIARSLQEATLKIAFICLADAEERSTRLNEYSQDLWEIDLLRRSKRMREILSFVDDERLRASFEPLVLDDGEERELAEKWSRKRRTVLQHRWSFMEMLKSMNASFAQETDGRVWDIMVHNYDLSSHLIHADHTALGLVADRLSRELGERRTLTVAHRIRFLSDAFSLTGLSCTVIRHAFGARSDLVRSVADELAPAFERMMQLAEDAGRE